jgi:antitoxin MazE
MKASIVQIGNSRGIRIPKPICEQCGFVDEVDIEVHNHTLIIRSKHVPREGWSDAYKSMAQCADDMLFDRDAESQSRWDDNEWEWNNEKV